jgi:cytochrome c heme-lyase
VKKKEVSAKMGASQSTSKSAQSTPPSPQVDVCPVRQAPKVPVSSEGGGGEGGCPVKHGKEPYKNKDVYNVYNQKIDPKNQMPSNANQLKSAGQSIDLPVERVKSTIPKGGTESDTWQYPSPQMFWNALVRKNKTEGASEADIESVVAVHNNMNETTWKQVMIWESLMEENGVSSTLLRFLGRPDDLSPRAQLKALFGHPKPFDRHDWYVDRGGKEVRYIIDYYHDESNVTKDKSPKSMHDTMSMKSIQVEVRPALDSFEALYNRVVGMPLALFKNDAKVAKYVEVPFLAPKVMVEAEVTKGVLIAKQWQDIQIKCESAKAALHACEGDAQCGAASVALQKCTASVVCPDITEAFERSIKAQSEVQIEQSYGKMLKCLEMFEIDSRDELMKRR